MGMARVRLSVLLAATARLGGCQAEDLKVPGPTPDLGMCFAAWHAIVFPGSVVILPAHPCRIISFGRQCP